MATWISHMMIVDNLFNRNLDVDKIGFCVGNIALDCNVENEDWTEFTPPREVTHWMRGETKMSADYDGFYDEYIKGRSFTSKMEYSFYIGYYAHLITDVMFQKMVRNEERVEKTFERIKRNAEMSKEIEGEPENFDTLKRIFGRENIFSDVAFIEYDYLKKNPMSAYNTILQKITEFPDYMDMFPKGAITRKIKIMAYEPEECQSELLFFEAHAYEEFIQGTADFIYEKILRNTK